MGLKDRRKEKPVEPPKKVETKKVEPPKTFQKVVTPIVKTTKVETPKVTPPVKVEKAPEVIKVEETVSTKNEHAGIGLIGSHNELTKFKSICKLKNLKLGAELLTMIKEFNSKNG